MKAFVEFLCEHVCIIRSGPNAEKYGDSYEESVTGEFSSNGIITLKGFSGRATFSHVKSVLKAVNELGFEVQWERYGTNNPHLIQITHDETGAIHMKRSRKDRPHGHEHSPHPHEAINDNGSVNLQSMLEGAQEFEKAVRDGHIEILGADRIDLHDGSFINCFHVRLTGK